MLSFLKLIRIKNLLIIAFTQYMVRWCLVYPILKVRNYDLQLSNFHFFLLVLSTVMLAAAGYIINDYFDVRIDKVNKPERLVIDKGVKRRVAMGAHTFINILAVLIGFYVSYAIGLWKLSIIHIICASTLWFYSTHFKRQFLIGNFIVAFFTAMVPLIVGIYELYPCYKVYAVLGEELSFKSVWIYVFAVSFFAFITTLLREIIKDIEDYQGDKEYGCQTLPIVIGKQNAKIVVAVISIACMICLSYLQYRQFKAHDWLAFFYFVFALQLPFVFLIYKTLTAQTKKDFRFAANTAKLIMLMGVFFLFIFAYNLLSSIHAI